MDANIADRFVTITGSALTVAILFVPAVTAAATP